MTKESKIWLEISRELAEGLVERLAKSESDFARRLHRELDRQLNRHLYVQKKRGLTQKDSLGPEVLKIKERVMKARRKEEKETKTARNG